MNKKFVIILVILVIGGGLLYWNNISNHNNQEPSAENKVENKTENKVENKEGDLAGEYCTKNGGSVTKEKKPDGSDYELCYFDDNRACITEAMKIGECPVGGVKTTGYDNIYQKYCAWSGGKTIAEANAKCTFKDGSFCSAEEYYFGTCLKGKNK
ncbi:MAG: DUF333 domain-containing protein [Candidatus Pacebacteria bacterium]|nr:DUF333 domain-containing protein [Candidatus Paceibacterota bacterium]